MTDVARLAVEVDSKGIRIARSELDRLGTTGGKAARKVTTATGRMRSGFTGLQASVVSLQGAFAALGAAAVVRELIQSSIQLQRINSALRVATGSSKGAAREFQFVSDQAERLGLNLRSAATEYSSLAAAAKGTNLQGQATRDIFTGVSEAATALNLSAEQTGGALTAISQIISKGTVQAEELRGQLGERLPGAFQIAARAMGVTTQELGKLLQQGKVASDDFLPKFARELHNTFSGDAARAADNLQQNINRLDNAFFNITSSGNVDGLSGSIGHLADTLNDPDTRAGIQTIVQGIVDITSAATEAVSEVGELIKSIENLDLSGVGEFLFKRTGPGYIADKMGWLGSSDQTDAGQANTGRSPAPAGPVTRDQVLAPSRGGPAGGGPSSQAEQSIQQLQKQIALYGDLSHAEQARISLANGYYGTVTPAQKQLIMSYAQQLDALNNQADALQRNTDLVTSGNDAWRQALDNQKKALAGVTDALMTSQERAKAAMERRAEVVRNSTLSEAAQTKLLQKNWDQYAATVGDDTGQASKFAQRAAENIQDELGSSMESLLSGHFDGILKSWGDMVMKMAAQAEAAQLGKALLGEYGNTGQIGGLLGKIGGLFGSGLSQSTVTSMNDAGIGMVGLSGTSVPTIPGRVNGGSTAANSLYQVVEKGQPEMYTQGGRSYLMTGSGDGFVTPMVPGTGSSGGGSGGGGNTYINITNEAGNDTKAEVTSQRSNGLDKIIDVKIKKYMQGDLSKRGPVSRGFERAYSLQRNGSGS